MKATIKRRGNAHSPMKLFLWKNAQSSSDFVGIDKANCYMPKSSNCHSGGVVVLATSEDEAVALIKKFADNIDIREMTTHPWWHDEPTRETTPIVIPLDKKGVVIYCAGDC